MHQLFLKHPAEQAELPQYGIASMLTALNALLVFQAQGGGTHSPLQCCCLQIHHDTS